MGRLNAAGRSKPQVLPTARAPPSAGMPITLSTDQAAIPSQSGRRTFTAPEAHWRRTDAKGGAPRRTRKRFDNTCSISFAGPRSMPMGATTAIRTRHTSRPSLSFLNGVTSDSFQRWRRLPDDRKWSACAPTSRKPRDSVESGWGSELRPSRRGLPARWARRGRTAGMSTLHKSRESHCRCTAGRGGEPRSPPIPVPPHQRRLRLEGARRERRVAAWDPQPDGLRRSARPVTA